MDVSAVRRLLQSFAAQGFCSNAELTPYGAVQKMALLGVGLHVAGACCQMDVSTVRRQLM
jgi:hypothetical protein